MLYKYIHVINRKTVMFLLPVFYRFPLEVWQTCVGSPCLQCISAQFPIGWCPLACPCILTSSRQWALTHWAICLLLLRRQYARQAYRRRDTSADCSVKPGSSHLTAHRSLNNNTTALWTAVAAACADLMVTRVRWISSNKPSAGMERGMNLGSL